MARILGWHDGSIGEIADEDQGEYDQWKDEQGDRWSNFFGNDAFQEDEEENVDC